MPVSARTIRDLWPRSKGFFVLRYVGPRGTVWAKTRSAEIAANLTRFGFLGAHPFEVRWAGLRTELLPEYA